MLGCAFAFASVSIAATALVTLLYFDRKRLLKEVADLHGLLLDREAEAHTAREQIFNAMLQMRNVPNGRPLAAQTPESNGKIWTKDERERLNDSIDEYMEVRQMDGKPVSREEARMFVWNRNGYTSPQF